MTLFEIQTPGLAFNNLQVPLALISDFLHAGLCSFESDDPHKY